MKSKVIIAVIIVLALVVLICGYVYSSQESTGNNEWKWEITNGNCTGVAITQEMLDCVGSTNPDGVFSSLLNTEGLVVFYTNPETGDMSSWLPDRIHNTLVKVIPGTYQICINHGEDDQTLIISKC